MAVEVNQRGQWIKKLKTVIEATDKDEFRELDFYQVAARIDRAKEIFTEAGRINDLYALGLPAGDDQNKAWDEFNALELNYLDALAVMRRRFVALTPHTVVQPDDVAGAASGSSDQNKTKDAIPIEIRFPMQMHTVPDTWGIFNGDRLSWSEWKEKFCAAVHNSKDFTAIQKFTFLKKALIGEPAELVKRWGISEENYVEAWKRLEEKYDKRYPLVCAHLGKFFALPELQKRATATQLQTMCNGLHELVRHMDQLKYNITNWDIILVQAIQSRLDTHYRGEWHKVRADKEEPTWKDMAEFLDKEAALIADRNLSNQSDVAEANQGSSFRRMQSAVVRPERDEIMYPCPVCTKFGHKVFDCPDFKPLSVAQRLEKVVERRLCPNCLRRGHAKEDCYDMKRCTYYQCRNKNDTMHNSLLCPFKNDSNLVAAFGYNEPSSHHRNRIRRASPSPTRDIPKYAGRGRGIVAKRPNSQNL